MFTLCNGIQRHHRNNSVRARTGNTHGGFAYSAALAYWSPSNAFNYITRYHSSKRASTAGACNDPIVDELIEQIQTTMDDDARLELINECVRRVNEIAIQPSLYQPITFRAYNKDLAGMKFSAHGYFDISNIHWEE